MPGYIVSGAGDANINGPYTLSGQSSGKDYFTFAAGVGGPYYIFWLFSNFWVLNNVLSSMPANWQFIASGAAQPPLVGWGVGGSGTPPAGTLAAILETQLTRTAAAVLNRDASAVLDRT